MSEQLFHDKKKYSVPLGLEIGGQRAFSAPQPNKTKKKNGPPQS
jgi:hypothetical protein